MLYALLDRWSSKFSCPDSAPTYKILYEKKCHVLPCTNRVSFFRPRRRTPTSAGCPRISKCSPDLQRSPYHSTCWHLVLLEHREPNLVLHTKTYIKQNPQSSIPLKPDFNYILILVRNTQIEFQRGYVMVPLGKNGDKTSPLFPPG